MASFGTVIQGAAKGAQTIRGSIYVIPGRFTPSGKDYVGRTEDLDKRARDRSDGRDRTKAEEVGTYQDGNVSAGRKAEQDEMNRRGGKEFLDNKRDEIARKNWENKGVTPPQDPEP